MAEDRFALRPGERRLGFDPATHPRAQLTFIGRIRSSWGPENCPKNLMRARDSGQTATVEIDLPYRAGLEGIAPGGRVLLLYWMDHAPRDLIRQVPRHRPEGAGVFALRSPARPNPVSLAAVVCTAIDHAAGRMQIDAIDCYDGTPLLDIKPWLPTVDIPPDTITSG